MPGSPPAPSPPAIPDPGTLRNISCGLDHRHARPFRIQRPEGSGDWLLLLITSPVLVAVEGALRQMAPPLGLLYGPRDAQDYGAWGALPGDGPREHQDSWVHFSGSGAAGLVAELGLPVARPWAVRDRPALERGFRELCREALRQAPHHHRALAAGLTTLLVAAARDAMADPAGRHDEALRDLRAEVHGRLGETWSVPAMARRVGLSAPRFTALYRLAFGTSPIDDLLEARIDLACRLLAAGRAPGAVAVQAGFGDLTHFYRQFRRRCGRTPGRWRADHGHPGPAVR